MTDIETFGRYIPERLLGSGAMGKVYCAHDPVLDRRIALKVISVDLSVDDTTRKDFLSRFALEARASARLNHPSIVAVYDAGEEKGLPWIAFQYVEGETLEKYLQRREKLSCKQAIAIGLDIAGALKHAHAAQIIHRDVKPANILIDAETGIAKLADFGIVKAPWSSMTRAGDSLGSPGYMSPEQIEGISLDERADLFCLGVVMYQMISGKNPFIRDTVASTVFATCHGHYTPLRDLAKGVPASLERIIKRCLMSDRRKRMRSAEELVNLLSALSLGTTRLDNPVEDATAKKPSTISFSALTRKIKLPKGKREFLAQSGLALWTWWQGIAHTFVLWLIEQNVLVRDKIKNGFVKFVSGTLAVILAFFARSVLRSGIFIGVIAGAALVGVFSLVYSIGEFSAQPFPLFREAKALHNGQHALLQNDRKSALVQANTLIDMDNLHAASQLFIVRTMIRDGKYDVAARHLMTLRRTLKGKQYCNHHIGDVLLEVENQLTKGDAPAALIDMLRFSLALEKNPRVRLWSVSNDYWLRWNAVNLLNLMGIVPDMVKVYTNDLSYKNSVLIRMRAVHKLAELGDKRAIPALKEASRRGSSDPVVAEEALKVLKEKF